MQTFKAYRTFEDDKVVSSRFVDTTLDELDPGEVVVRTKYSTINYKDALSHNGSGAHHAQVPDGRRHRHGGHRGDRRPMRGGSAATR